MVEDAVGKILVGGEHRRALNIIVHLVHVQQRRSLWHLKNISQSSVRSHRPQVRQVQIGRNSADILEEIENGLAQLLRWSFAFSTTSSQ